MTKDQLEKHKKAAQKLWLVNQKTFRFIKKNIGKASEYDVNRFILSEFKKQGMVADKKHLCQIVAAGENTDKVHYFPLKNKSKIIQRNSLILIDTWARLKEKDSPFADITWMAYSGKSVPKDIQRVFDKVIRARDITLDYLRKSVRRGKFPKTKEIDKVARKYFKKFNLEKNFLHGTGHSLGIKECHGRYFRFGEKSGARLKPNIPFTIEPGLYLKDKFGVRSEINCYVDDNRKLIVTTEIQNKIIKI
ncbi:MAG: M24 family metallopeptidase [Candidatus Nealsonbacteria bacterium]